MFIIQNEFILDIGDLQPVFAVVFSYDCYLNYVKIMKSASYLKDPNVHFIATHEDMKWDGRRFFQTTAGKKSSNFTLHNPYKSQETLLVPLCINVHRFLDIVVPGPGITSSVLRAISERKPMVMGKPATSMWFVYFVYVLEICV